MLVEEHNRMLQTCARTQTYSYVFLYECIFKYIAAGTSFNKQSVTSLSEHVVRPKASLS